MEVSFRELRHVLHVVFDFDVQVRQSALDEFVNHPRSGLFLVVPVLFRYAVVVSALSTELDFLSRLAQSCDEFLEHVDDVHHQFAPVHRHMLDLTFVHTVRCEVFHQVAYRVEIDGGFRLRDYPVE